MSLNIYVLMPTAKPERGQAAGAHWKSQGYKMAYFLDEGRTRFSNDLTLIAPYEGVWAACNALARAALAEGADICLFAGDDMAPDPNHSAAEIGRQYLDRFPDGFGVMQPCGDPQGRDSSGKSAAARICGSAWFGKGWITRAYQGQGPTNANYFHFYSDEELALVAQDLGVMWWRPDLSQYHYHWSFGHMPQQDYHKKAQQKWFRDKALFEARAASGFAGSTPLPLEESCK